MLKLETKAPDFTLPGSDGKTYSLSDYKGTWVVIFFYPKDNTLFCTKEACSIRDNFEEFKFDGVKTFGINSDSIESHKSFVNKYNLPFPLLTDSSEEVIKKYEAKGLIMVKRITYLISPEGTIKKAYGYVNSFTHGKDILNDLKILKTADKI